MVTVGASGREVSLTAGDYRARIVTVGAGLAGLTYRGHELIIPHSVDECPPRLPGQGAHALAESHRRRHLFVGRGPPTICPSTSTLSARLCTALWPSKSGNRRGRHLLGAPAHLSSRRATPTRGRSLRPLATAWIRSAASPSNCRQRTSARAPPPTASDSIPTWLSTVYGWMIWSLRIPRRLSTRPTPP